MRPTALLPSRSRAGTLPLVHLLLLLIIPFGSALAAGTPISGTGDGTEEKPQSKLWWADQTWWAVLSRSGSGLHFFEFDAATQQWEPCAYMDADISASGRADVKWNGSELFVLAYTKSPKLFKYSYDHSLRTWNLESGFPVHLPITSGSETMVLDQDTTGRLWTSWEGDNNVWVAWSTSPDHTHWSEPLSLRASVDSDDISSVVAFGSDIGVFWSDQRRDEFGFRVHHDADFPDVWSDVEVADSGDGRADDHICIKASSSGRLFAVTKDDHDKMFLHRRDTNGSWKTVSGVISGTGTRGSLMICDDSEKLYVAYTDWSSSSNKIKLRRASYSSMDFSTYVSSFISGGTFNNATGCKQTLPEGCYMGLAGGAGNTWWNGWGDLPPDGPPPPEAPGIPIATLQEISREAAAHADMSLNLTLDEGQGTTTTGSTSYAHEGELDGIVGKTSGPTWTSGQSGSGLHFEGDSWVRIESTPDLQIPGSFTIETWVRRYPDVSGDGTILSKGPSQSRNYHLLLLKSGRIEFKWEVSGGSNRGVTSSQALTPGAWQHVTCIYDSENGASRIYIDGHLDATASDSGTPVTNDEPLHLGRRMSGTTPKDYLTADLDGIRIWRGVAYTSDFTPGPIPHFPSGAEPIHHVDLQWSAPANEDGKLVYSVAMRYGGSGWFALADHLSDTHWTHNAPVLGTSCYAIRATRVDDGLVSKPSLVWVEYVKPREEHETPPDELTLAKGNLSLTLALQASPNPFNPQTTVQLQLPQAGPVTLSVYDVRGRRVRSLHRGVLQAGRHDFTWDARTDHGERLASGVYFLRGEILGEILRKRLVLLK